MYYNYSYTFVNHVKLGHIKLWNKSMSMTPRCKVQTRNVQKNIYFSLKSVNFLISTFEFFSTR